MTNKLKYFVGNWKMFGDISSFKIIQQINKYIHESKKANNKKVIICIPNTLIHFFKKKLKSKHISLGAQNCYHEEGFGPYTGSVSASMLKKVGAEYVILGHSENRMTGDTDIIIKRKIISSIKQKLIIIFCIGETLKQKKRKQTFAVLKRQLKNSLYKNLDKSRLIIAYEPVWSIGTNKILNKKELKKIFIYLKINLKKILKTQKVPKVLYGGSVNSKNINILSSIKEIDGFLIGGASQSAKKFIDIMKNYYK